MNSTQLNWTEVNSTEAAKLRKRKWQYDNGDNKDGNGNATDRTKQDKQDDNYNYKNYNYNYNYSSPTWVSLSEIVRMGSREHECRLMKAQQTLRSTDNSNSNRTWHTGHWNSAANSSVLSCLKSRIY